MALDDVNSIVQSDETILMTGSTLIEIRGNEKARWKFRSKCDDLLDY